MNYGTYINNKIIFWNWWTFSIVSFYFLQKYLVFKMLFCIVGVFCIINWYFEYRSRIRCIWLYMGTCFNLCDIFDIFQNMSRKCEQFSYELFLLRCLGILWYCQHMAVFFLLVTTTILEQFVFNFLETWTFENTNI